jgi:hypothetical protein
MILKRSDYLFVGYLDANACVGFPDYQEMTSCAFACGELPTASTALPGSSERQSATTARGYTNGSLRELTLDDSSQIIASRTTDAPACPQSGNVSFGSHAA